MPRLELAGADQHSSPADDPAILIGLALACVRQGPLLDGFVPEPLMLRLNALADEGDVACRLLRGWLQNRNRDYGWRRSEHLSRSTPLAASADIHLPRRTLRKRVLAAVTTSHHRERRRRIWTRPRDPAVNPETAAIIAAETGGRADG